MRQLWQKEHLKVRVNCPATSAMIKFGNLWIFGGKLGVLDKAADATYNWGRATKQVAEGTKQIGIEQLKAAAAVDRDAFLAGQKKSQLGAGTGDGGGVKKTAIEAKAAEGSLKALRNAAAELEKTIEETPSLPKRIAKAQELEAVEKKIKDIETAIQNALHPKVQVSGALSLGNELETATMDVPEVIAEDAHKKEKERVDKSIIRANDTANAKTEAARREKDALIAFLNEINDKAQAVGGALNNIAGGLSAYFSAQQDAELASFDKAQDEKLKAAANSEALQTKIKEDGDAQRSKMERDYYIKNARMQQIQAGINGAMAITSILASPANKIDPTGALMAFQIAAATAATALQIAAIEKSIGKFEYGGMIKRQYGRGGALHGKRHSQGGIHIEAEDGEVVINRNSARMFLPELSAINQAGGGVPLFANGGVVGSTVPINGAGALNVRAD